VPDGVKFAVGIPRSPALRFASLTGLLASGLPLVGLMAGFGLAIAGAMLLVIGWRRRLAARPGQQPAAGSQAA
jgi:hypothetical protein